jgi:RNA polymerase-binding transcription factor DksA
MSEPKMSKERLEKRREEILAQLGEESRDVQIELDRDPEEQAIQIEQHEVSISMIENLRRELADVEEKLAEADG